VGFWTDFVRGRTLSAVVGEQGPLGYREAALVGLDVTRALSAVHRAGILHRDIKGENVMREEGGRILLMDFGLSTVAQRQANLAGTPNYMAPELFSGQPASVASDIYAVGILLYFLVTGAYPVRLSGLSSAAVGEAMARRMPLMDMRADLPESFVRVVGIATDLDPAKRYARAEMLGGAGPFAQEPALDDGNSGRSKRKDKKEKERVAPVLRFALLVLIGAFFALKSQTVKTYFHAKTEDTSSTSYERFQKAQELLQKSYQHSNRAEAIGQFQALLADDPNFALAHAGLGSAYLIQFRSLHDPKLLDQAKAETTQAIALNPGLAPPYATLGRIAAIEGQNSLAMQQVQKAMSLDPTSADAYRALADVYEAEGRKPDAIAALQKAEDLGPDDWRWPMALGVSYLSVGKLNEAKEQFQRSADLAHDNATAYYNLGIVDRRLEKLNEAQANLEKSLQIEATPATYIELGALMDEQGKYAEAVPMYAAAAKLNPSDHNAWSGMAGDYLLLPGRHGDALAAYRKAIEVAEAARAKQPKNAELLSALGYYYAQVGDKTHGHLMIRQALALAPENPVVEYGAGSTFELMGEREKAMRAIAKSLAMGYSLRNFEREPLLTGLRSDPAFAAVVLAQKSEKPMDNMSPIQ
jgi:tetratricopeptide (TPR) repeat protein